MKADEVVHRLRLVSVIAARRLNEAMEELGRVLRYLATLGGL